MLKVSQCKELQVTKGVAKGNHKGQWPMCISKASFYPLALRWFNQVNQVLLALPLDNNV